MQEIYNAILGHVPKRMPIFIMRTDIVGSGATKIKGAKPECRPAPDWPDQNTLWHR
ncbi:hypothetical protein [Methylobacter tundripaludum]|uniref:hypothetical protein n=1 Tax=Methylobacter tundripaludum TaxID=173365 RepID=UPI0013631329|nr:hypothetical protein [Methylobacter tundripaludum]